MRRLSLRADFVNSQSARLFTKWQNLAFDVTNTIEAIGEFLPVTPLSSFGRVHAVFAAFIIFFGFSDLIEILLKSPRWHFRYDVQIARNLSLKSRLFPTLFFIRPT